MVTDQDKKQELMADEFVSSLRDIVAPWMIFTRNKPIDWDQDVTQRKFILLTF